MSRSTTYEPAPFQVLPAVASVAAMLLILFSTVFRGSNRYVPLTLAEWLGLLLVVAVCGSLLARQWTLKMPSGMAVRGAAALLIAAPLWLALLQSALLPQAARMQIWASALAGVPAVALCLAALSCDESRLQLMIRGWIVVAGLQALLGIAQLSGLESLRFGMGPNPASSGTFANRNHFANLLAMTIPLVILELRLQSSSGRASSRIWWWACLLFLMVAALLASESRAGLVTAVLAGTAAASVVFGNGKKRSWVSRAAVWLVPGLVVLALVAGGLDWLYRFDIDALSSSALERAQNRDATWQGAIAHLPWGSGLGNFIYAFGAWQPVGYAYWLDYAHSDFLQLLFETGVFALVLAAAVVWLVTRRVAQIAREARTDPDGLSRHARLGLVALCGLLALVVHAWVDFPTHIPANAMLAAFLFAVFLRERSDISSKSYKK